MLSTYEPAAQQNVKALQEQSPSNEFSLASWTAIHNMKNTTIRALNENDACDFHTLRLRALKEHPDAFSSTYERESAYSMEFVAERLRRTAESRNNFTLGAYLQEELIGVVGFRRIDGVKEQHRGAHLGHVCQVRRTGKGHWKGPPVQGHRSCQFAPRTGTDRARRSNSKPASQKSVHLSRFRLVRHRPKGVVRKRGVP